MIWRIEIKDKEGIFDAAGSSVARDIEDFGIRGVKDVGVTQVFLIEGKLDRSSVKKICHELLADPVVQDFAFTDNPVPALQKTKTSKEVEIAYNPGVMDPVEESTLKGIRDLGIAGVRSVRTARKYQLNGQVSDQQLNIITDKVLANKIIQHVVTAKNAKGLTQRPQNEGAKAATGFSHPLGRGEFDVVLVDILNVKDKTLKEISNKGQLFLSLEEMRSIQKYFRKLDRNPTDCELETIAQTWSEHCHHKTFRGHIRYQFRENGRKKSKLIRGLLKSTIMKATKEINKSWCVSVFHDNSGVIEFDDEYNVCFKVETHNHPSALEPFGGANTGIGGVIRDCLGTGLGAKPICNTDVFCFAPPDLPFSKVPKGTLHPKRVMKGVVSGVRDYGNKMGIPTVNGAIVFDERFVANPLVYCGTVGMIPRDKVEKSVKPGDLIVAVGGRTGHDGIHGATFSSGELTHESEVISSGAVQIGHPIQEKKVLDCLLQARDKNLYTCVTDCGAGGFSSAVGEMGKDFGCRVDLEKAPLKYQGLSYTEIWISESQERMVLSAPKSRVEELLKVFASENVEAVVIGEFTETRRLELFFNGCQVCDLDMGFLHDGIPMPTKEAVWTTPKIKDTKFPVSANLTKKLCEVLAHYNVCSKEWVIRQYDHEVQGGSVIKPLVGVKCDGPSDASVIRPRLNSSKGVAVANGINPRFGMIDPFWMAASCIDEAVRQIISVGGRLDKIAILDNFCWGNPDKKDRLGSLVRAAQGCYRAAAGYGVPFISGKDSLYNEYTLRRNGKSLPIPGTLLISALGIVDDVNKAVTMDLKDPGNFLYVLGETKDELGGSVYFETLKALGKNVPQVDFKKGTKIFNALSSAIKQELVAAVHDCSQGGLVAALAEMAFSGELGVEVHLIDVPYKGVKRNDYILFSESNTRFMVEVKRDQQKEFEKFLSGVVYNLIGSVTANNRVTVYGMDNKVCVDGNIHDLKEAWQKTLRW